MFLIKDIAMLIDIHYGMVDLHCLSLQKMLDKAWLVADVWLKTPNHWSNKLKLLGVEWGQG